VVLEAAPASYAVKIAGYLSFGEGIELLPLQLHRRFNKAGNAKVPSVGIEFWN
jgi:hypothetical protein